MLGKRCHGTSACWKCLIRFGPANSSPPPSLHPGTHNRGLGPSARCGRDRCRPPIARPRASSRPRGRCRHPRRECEFRHAPGRWPVPRRPPVVGLVGGGIVPAGGAPRSREGGRTGRSEEHTSELQSLMRISYAVFCLKKKKTKKDTNNES